MGGMAALLVVILSAPASLGDARTIEAMAKIAAWIVGPSMVVTIMSGLAAIAVHAGFHEAGWVWAKALTGVLVFEGGLHVLGPLQEQAKRGAAAVEDTANTARLLAAETNTLWLLLAVSAFNIALGVWRPRIPSIPV